MIRIALSLAALGTPATAGAQGMTVTPSPAPTHVAPAPVYVVPVQPRDPRTPRERCRDSELARLGVRQAISTSRRSN